jgi:hypothetical protein
MAERRYKHPQVNLRMPEELKDKVSTLAARNGRSANAEMVAAIEFWISANQEILENPDKYPMNNERVEISKSAIPDIVNAVRKQILEHLAENYDLHPKKNKNPS